MSIYDRTRDGLLLASPAAMEDETVASWIQYVCAMHQYSFNRLTSILGFAPADKDWDRWIEDGRWSDLLQRTACPESTCSLARQAFIATRGQLSPYLKESPYYQWCIRCLEEDARPYLRWWWKSKGKIVCPTHRAVLSSICPCCDGPLKLDRALMVAAGNPYAIPDFRFCQHCGMPRGGQPGSFWSGWSIDSRRLAIQKAYVENPGGSAVILRAVLRDEDLRRWERGAFFSPLSEILSDAELDFLRALRTATATRGDGNGSSDGTQATAGGLGWSKKIPKSQARLRLKLAYALAVFRKERLRLRREAASRSSQSTTEVGTADG